MAIITRGFRGRRDRDDTKLPPGQYLETGFPVLSAGPTPRIPTDQWAFDVTRPSGERSTIDWATLMGLPIEEFTVDIHCVTKWSKLGTRWRGVAVDDLLAAAGVPAAAGAPYTMVHSYGGYTTNVPLDDLLGHRAWVVFEYEGKPLHPEHGGPARLLVPHLYFWKSAKWVNGLRLMAQDAPGFWENVGYHLYGDPWREQRYWGD